MPTLEDMREFLEELSLYINGDLHSDAVWGELEDAFYEALSIVKEYEQDDAADYEHKLTKLADAIERGEHEC